MWTFFRGPKFLGAGLPKIVYAHYHPCLALRCNANFVAQRAVEGVVVIIKFLKMFDMSIRSGDIRNQIEKLLSPAPFNGQNVVSREMSTWVGQYEPLELFCLWTKAHHFFAQHGRVFFQMFDVSIRFGYIRDQSRKLSKNWTVPG